MDSRQLVEVDRVAWKRMLLVGAGFLSLGIGLIGVVVPLLPTTPFLLIAAACFLHGSARWHTWLLGNRLFGSYLRDYLEDGRVSPGATVFTLALLWVTLSVSMILASKWYVTLALAAIGIGVTLHLIGLSGFRPRRRSVLDSVAAGRGVASGPEVVERCEGHSGELVLRRSGADLEIILNGVFLISTANEDSSRAMVAVALPEVQGAALDVLIGGLGLGYALDEALACERVRRVTVAEIEPVVERWFALYGQERAERAAEGGRVGRVVILSADVGDVLADHPCGFDIVSLDTDNGPEWLVRDENLRLYSDGGLRTVRQALRPGGAAVFWSPEQYPRFQEALARVFDRVAVVPAQDVVGGRCHDYAMYVGVRSGVGDFAA